jgi:hypothetical protein
MEEDINHEFWDIMTKEFGEIENIEFTDEEIIDMNSILSVFKVIPIKPGIFVLISEDRYYGEETF